ncbi:MULTISPECIES: hypothetical protein [unclassified Amycolatopsis]|uniref:hypothetical protein n=1 Tax=unclassified Amycolatopsis TaxID=2618356 RepID=UPI002876DCA6|nr:MULTISPECIES: hypothetical protein [unclassified Amycolatopsis]MDS0134798.1 hypothetical protein [Amycolatopsis sp. 505]MDS0148026.1 hypothetical protein [Amycolatopsis sp. CM201R]
MRETGEVSGASDEPEEVRRAEGMQEADDEELEAREDVRADVAVEVVNTVGGEIAAAITPVARDLYENREHWKIQADAALAKLERKFGKKSEE